MPSRSFTAAPHCSAESRHRRRGIAGSDVHATVVPPARPVPVVPPAPAVPVDPPEQTPALQVAPAGHGLQPPQCMASPVVAVTQEPSEHIVDPVGHIPWQLPLLQTSVPVHIVVQEPQCAAFEATHIPLHDSRPALQTHWPDWHTWPIPQPPPQVWPSTLPWHPAAASNAPSTRPR